MISAHSPTSSVLRSTRWWFASPASPLKKRPAPLTRTLRGLRAVALGDTRDDLFLGWEIAIKIAWAHPGLGADFLHRGLVEARAGKARLRGDEDFVAAVGLRLDVGATHEFVPCNNLERTFVR